MKEVRSCEHAGLCKLLKPGLWTYGDNAYDFSHVRVMQLQPALTQAKSKKTDQQEFCYSRA